MTFDEEFQKAHGLVLVCRRPNELSPTSGTTGHGGGKASGGKQGVKGKGNPAPMPKTRQTVPNFFPAHPATYVNPTGITFDGRSDGRSKMRLSAKEARNASKPKKGGVKK